MHVASAPGRVNLMGEHTDYNHGFVLPLALPFQTVVRVKCRQDAWVHVCTTHQQGEHHHAYRLGTEQPGKNWFHYIQGISQLLGITQGCDISIDSKLPLGSGLSSSAALLVAVLKALNDAYALQLMPMRIAFLAQQIENNFIGAQVGMMDPLACSFAKEDRALLIDTQSHELEEIAIPPELEIGVIHSGIQHNNSDGNYNLRRQECQLACIELGISSLRDIQDDDLSDITQRLPGHLAARVRHVVSENKRVHETVSALRSSKLSSLKPIFAASHRSMRDLYQVSLPAIDCLVEIANSHRDCLGARLTGGGFGGCIVVLTQKGIGKNLSREICQRYREQSKHIATPVV